MAKELSQGDLNAVLSIFRHPSVPTLATFEQLAKAKGANTSRKTKILEEDLQNAIFSGGIGCIVQGQEERKYYLIDSITKNGSTVPKYNGMGPEENVRRRGKGYRNNRLHIGTADPNYRGGRL